MVYKRFHALITDMSAIKKHHIEKLGNSIRNTRKLAGLSQLELAQIAGVGKALIFEIEKGKQRVTLEKLLKITKVLNIKIEIITPVDISDEE